MATQQGDDIQELKLDVGLIKGDIRRIYKDMSSNQKVIIDRMDNFAFVSQKDYDKDMVDLKKAIADIVTENSRMAALVDAGGVKSINFIFGNVTKTILTVLSIAVVIIIVWGLFSTIPAVQSALGNVHETN